MPGAPERKRCLMIGAGGMAAGWVRNILPKFQDRLEVVGLVDVSETALAESRDFLGLDARACFADMSAAFSAVAADCCIIVVPARFHADAAVLAAQHGMAILCEKPLAESWSACRDIVLAVRAAGVKMQVVQNYRYRAPMLAFKKVLASGELGRLNYITCRFGHDCREYDTWQRRHELPHAMIVDGAAHHFDMLRHLSGADCARISALEWNPPWSSSRGEFCALCLLHLTDGTRATYEGNATAAGEQHPWRFEDYRAECEGGSLTVGADQVVRMHRHSASAGVVTTEVAAPVPEREGHLWIVNEFLDWLDGGPTPLSVLDDNIRTAAMIFGALDSARTGQTVDVQAMVDAALVPAVSI